MNLCLGASGELFVVDLDHVCFFQADDHYAHVYYDTNAHFMIPFGLVCLEEEIAVLCGGNNHLVRVGRSYIVNLKKVFYINVLKQEVMLTSVQGQHHVLHVSKTALRNLMEKVKEDNKE